MQLNFDEDMLSSENKKPSLTITILSYVYVFQVYLMMKQGNKLFSLPDYAYFKRLFVPAVFCCEAASAARFYMNTHMDHTETFVPVNLTFEPPRGKTNNVVSNQV